MTLDVRTGPFEPFVRAQPAAAAALQSAVRTETVAHAWLLLGPAGGGQVEAARFLGAALNCADDDARSLGLPCGTCPSCHRVLAGTHTAVRDFTPEGAMHRVAEVRDEWIPAATRTSLDGRWKVFRIVAADRMNEAAQNAFLKILEEPPASVIWILDVADDAALLDTIISRCRRLDVTPWSQPLLRERLDGWILDGEGDPGLGSGEEAPPVARASASSRKHPSIEHLPAPAPAERTSLVRLAKGSPQMLATLATCDGRRVREIAVGTVPRILELGPKAAGGVAPSIANDVLAMVAQAQARIQLKSQQELFDLGESLGLHMVHKPNGPEAKRPDAFPAGVVKRHKARMEREQRDVATATCRLYLDLLASALQDLLVGWQAGPDATLDEATVRNVDQLAVLPRLAARVDPAGIVAALAAIEHAHLGFDLNGERKLQLERVIIRVVLACARG